MRRLDREQDKEFALGVIEKCEYATLATVNEDGTPYCVPISPILFENHVYIHCAMEGKKVENIKRSNSACISGVGHTKLIPEKFTTEFESVVINGKCYEVEDKGEKIHALKLICEKYARSNMDGFDKAISASLHRTAVYKINIEQISGKAKLFK